MDPRFHNPSGVIIDMNAPDDADNSLRPGSSSPVGNEDIRPLSWRLSLTPTLDGGAESKTPSRKPSCRLSINTSAQKIPAPNETIPRSPVLAPAQAIAGKVESIAMPERAIPRLGPRQGQSIKTNQRIREPEVAELRSPMSDTPAVISWDGHNDPMNPQNWSRPRKWMLTCILSSVTFCVTFASSVFSTATHVTAIEYGVSEETMILGTSLFVLGFAVGPLLWGPTSELYGRKPPLYFGFGVFAILQIPVAVAQNFPTIMICRFLGGVFGCAPLAIIGGILADMWNPVDRGYAICVFAGATFIGPVAGPIVGSALVESTFGWRWTAWITLIMACTFGLIAFFVVPETYAPRLLQQHAKHMRFKTNNWAIHSALDENRIGLKTSINNYLLRPVKMLFTEPILVLMTSYMALIYGSLYLFFESYPIAFQGRRGWQPLVASLPFLGITVGVLIGVAIIVYMTKTRFARKFREYGRVVPEERLPPMIVGAFLFPIGLFWFGWTSSESVNWAPQVISGIFTGAGIMIIFMQGLNYIIDVYLMYANSAIAANTVVRSLTGAGFPLFARAMHNRLGVPWATSLLGFLAVAMIPVPILFFKYGKTIRGWSKVSPSKI